MKISLFTGVLCCMTLLLTGCSADTVYTRHSRINDVIRDEVFEDYGRLLFPLDKCYYSGNTLEDLKLVYYSHIDPNKTVEIVNTLHDKAAEGQTIFYDIYTDEEKAADPDKNDTGQFSACIGIIKKRL